MQKFILISIFLIPFFLFSQSEKSQKRVLMVLSSYGKDLGDTRPGFEFDEFSQAYLIFDENNLEIDLASPRGGEVEPDKYNLDKKYNKIVSDNPDISELLNNTIATSNVDPTKYDAIYIVGGKGAMFDLPYDPSLQEIILDLYQREGTVISSVCHGPAALVNVLHEGEYIVKNIEVTGFTNTEESLFGKKWVKEFPFKLEDKLISRGASFNQADFMLAKVSVSGKFVTGQNPFSTTRSAEEVVKALGITPVDRKLYKDEKSIYLIQDVLNGKKNSKWIVEEMKNNNQSYDMPLIAVWGYYKILSADENLEEISKGVQIVEMTSPYFFDENLQLALAKAHIALDNKKRAKEILVDLNSKNLLVEQANELLKGIDVK